MSGSTYVMRVVIVHDWFVFRGGAEVVVKSLLECFPDADVYSLLDFMSLSERQTILQNKNVRVSFLQYIPGIKSYYRLLLPLFQNAIRSLDVSEYDLVISSSHAVAKGVKTHANQTHICYCHTPVRYAWDLQSEYLEQVPPVSKNMVKLFLSRLRKWDLKSNTGVHEFVANSQYIADRIHKNYKRESTVIYPPVDTIRFDICPTSEKKSFLVVSRLVKYKKVDVIINAFNRFPDLKLRIIGTGAEEQKLKTLASDNIEWLGFEDDEKLVKEISNSRAIILAANEDFGITSIEAQACGIPVIAFNKGGYKETVVPNETGILFEEQTEESIEEAIKNFLKVEKNFDEQIIRKNALRFSKKRFKEEITNFVDVVFNKETVHEY